MITPCMPLMHTWYASAAYATAVAHTAANHGLLMQASGAVYHCAVYAPDKHAKRFLLCLLTHAGTPLAVVGKEDSEIHHTIAEMMILANSAVAEKIERAFPSSALVRTHAAPDPSRLTAFQDVAEKAGVAQADSLKRDKGGGKGATFLLLVSSFFFLWSGYSMYGIACL